MLGFCLQLAKLTWCLFTFVTATEQKLHTDGGGVASGIEHERLAAGLFKLNTRVESTCAPVTFCSNKIQHNKEDFFDTGAYVLNEGAFCRRVFTTGATRPRRQEHTVANRSSDSEDISLL